MFYSVKLCIINKEQRKCDEERFPSVSCSAVLLVTMEKCPQHVISETKEITFVFTEEKKKKTSMFILLNDGKKWEWSIYSSLEDRKQTNLER